MVGWRSLKALFCSIKRPSHSHLSSLVDTCFTSEAFIGQRKFPLSNRFIKSHKPDPSHCNIFMRLWFRLQNTNMHLEYGSSLNRSFTIAARPLKLFRRSVTPHAIYTCVPVVRSSICTKYSKDIAQCIRMTTV